MSFLCNIQEKKFFWLLKSQNLGDTSNFRKQDTFWQKIYFWQYILFRVVNCYKCGQGINITYDLALYCIRFNYLTCSSWLFAVSARISSADFTVFKINFVIYHFFIETGFWKNVSKTPWRSNSTPQEVLFDTFFL